MKRILATSLLSLALFASAFAQEDKSKRPSPPAQNTFQLANGVTVKLDYSQPGIKGRTIGKEIAPYGEVWRTGANEATIFEINKDVTVEGKTLKAGKYGLFTIPTANEWTIIFNNTWNQWGAYDYKEKDDALRIKVKPMKSKNFNERMNFSLNNKNQLTLNWGDVSVPFTVK